MEEELIVKVGETAYLIEEYQDSSIINKESEEKKETDIFLSSLNFALEPVNIEDQAESSLLIKKFRQ